MNEIIEFKKLVAPIQEWLKKNYNPHTTVVITSDFAKVVVDEFGCPANKSDDKETLTITDFTGETVTVELDGQEIAKSVIHNA